MTKTIDVTKDDCGQCVLLRKKCDTHNKKIRSGSRLKGLFGKMRSRELPPDPVASFTLTQFQVDAAKAWQKKHDSWAQRCPFRKPEHQGAIGGRMTWEFTANSIGETVRVRCACGKGVDLTDYDSW